MDQIFAVFRNVENKQINSYKNVRVQAANNIELTSVQRLHHATLGYRLRACRDAEVGSRQAAEGEVSGRQGREALHFTPEG